MKELFEKQKVKPSSIRTYISNIKRVIKLLDIKNDDKFKFLDNSNKIITAIKDIKITSKKNILTSIIILRKGQNKKIDKYGKKLAELDSQYRREMMKQKKSDKQKKQWAEVKDIENVVRKLKSKLKRNGLFNKDPEKFTNKELQLYQDYVLTLSYTKLHLRNDLVSLHVIKQDAYKKLSKSEKESNNWFINSARNKKIILYNFKTSKFVDLPVIYKIDKTLTSVYNKWLKLNKTKYLFINQKKQRITQNYLTKYLQRIFKKYINKSISTSMLRHIYLSDRLKDSIPLTDRMKLAKEFLHSVKTGDLYYRKIH